MLGEEIRDGKKHREAVYETKLKGLVHDIIGTGRRLIICSRSTGPWLRIQGTTVSGTVLSATEFRYFLCARYNVSPQNLQRHCGGYGTTFGMTYTLICSIGGLVVARHNKIYDELLYLSEHDFNSASVRAEPPIHQGHTKSKQDIRQGSDKDKETREGVMV